MFFIVSYFWRGIFFLPCNYDHNKIKVKDLSCEYMGYWNFERGKNQFRANVWIFSQPPVLIFLYFSILNFKIVQHWKNYQIPKIPSSPSSYQNVLLIFYLEFWELFITILNFNNLCFELMSWNLNNVEQCVRQTKWSSHHSIVSLSW